MRDDANEWLTLEEAAGTLKVSVAEVQLMVDRGALDSVLVGERLRIPARSMRHLADRAERQGVLRRLRGGRSMAAIAAVGLLLVAAGVFAATSGPFQGEVVPRQIPYRGFLERDGAPVTDRQVPMQFRLYTTEQGGGFQVWSESQLVSVEEGEFYVALGDTSAIPAELFAQPSLYLSVEVDGELLSGRQRLLTVPYAHHAARATVADRALSVDSVPTGAVMPFNLSTCPVGWSELTSARGRALVGRPSPGGVNLTVGTALTNGESRTHDHTIAHVHSFAGQVGDANLHTEVGSRTHGYGQPEGVFVVDTSANENKGFKHNHAVAGVVSQSSVASSGSASHQMPYVQLLVCVKS